MEPLLQAEHITICYHGTPVVCDVSFEIQKGEYPGNRRGFRKRKEQYYQGGNRSSWKLWYGNKGRRLL